MRPQAKAAWIAAIGLLVACSAGVACGTGEAPTHVDGGAPGAEAGAGGSGSTLDAGGAGAGQADAGSSDAGATDASATIDASGTIDACVPKTCDGPTAPTCGIDIDDGCGGVVSCPPCARAACTHRTTCDEAGATCGVIYDGCGGIVRCGTCDAPAVCVGNQCVDPSAPTSPSCAGFCVPKTCAEIAPTVCGDYSDGCGGFVTCTANCAPSDPSASCTPKTCASESISCGFLDDGCGHLIACELGPCWYGSRCKQGPNAQMCEPCDEPEVPRCSTTPFWMVSCTPADCSHYDGCEGIVPDGCGGALSCPGKRCEPRVDPTGCVPATCEELGATCGDRDDGCNGILHCGTCAAGTTCFPVPAKFGNFACVPCP